MVIDKKNADVKAPPKTPFMVQVAMRTNRDVFFFQVPCMVHTLLNPGKEMNPTEFKQYWEKIQAQNQSELKIQYSQLHAAFDQSNMVESVTEGLGLSLFKSQAKVRGRNNTANMLYFGSWLVNNLPLLMEVEVPDSGSELTVTLKFPVPQLKTLFEESIRYVLTRQ